MRFHQGVGGSGIRALDRGLHRVEPLRVQIVPGQCVARFRQHASGDIGHGMGEAGGAGMRDNE